MTDTAPTRIAAYAAAFRVVVTAFLPLAVLLAVAFGSVEADQHELIIYILGGAALTVPTAAFVKKVLR